MTTSIRKASEQEIKLFRDWKESKVQDITIEQLRSTHPENGYDNLPLKGIYHHQLIDSIMEMADKYGYKPVIGDLFAANNQDRNTPGVSILPRESELYGTDSPKSQILRRVYCNVNLKAFDDGHGDERNTANLAVSYHQGGIQVGFGPHVYICHNQCMLNANQSISTMGGSLGNRSSRGDGRLGGASIEQILATVDQWLREAPDRMERDRRRIALMKSIPVPHQQWLFLLGLLNEIRALHDSTERDIKMRLGYNGDIYPFSQTQLNGLALNAGIIYHKRSDVISLWDIYNCGTEFYKGNTMDIAKVIPQNEAFVSFLDKQYSFMSI